jgi:hypothetical protein
MQPVPNIGHLWPEQGGMNAGLMRGENGKPDYFLILATADEAKNPDVEWGGFKTETQGANHEFDGMENTIALIKDDASHPAAAWATDLNIEGHNDFYLPSRRELALLYANVPEQFDRIWYWSSTQFSAHTAWVQTFGVGNQDDTRKGGTCAARAVRRYYPFSDLTI